jgi:peptidoglycan/LPS O-acetylase OafA/YrhL
MTPAEARCNPLDGVRALAALSVVVFHSWMYRVGEPPGKRVALLDKVMFEANIGLICFFVLSGFLLHRPFARAALNNREPVNVSRYALRRMARILPAYYVSIVGCLFLYWAVGFDRLTPAAGELPLFALFGQNYSMDTVMEINPVTWTLCVEASFYVLLPLLGLVAYRLGSHRISRHVAMLLGLVGLTVATNAFLHGTDGGELISKALPTYIGFFALGMLAATLVEWRASRQASAAPLGGRATGAIVVLGMVLVFAHAYRHETAGSFNTIWTTFGNLPAGAGFALLIAGAATGTGPALGWLSARPLVYLGVVSYGIYLWHLPLLLVVREAGLLPVAFVPRLAVVLALAIAAGALSWKFVERPALRWAGSRRRRERRRRVGSARPAPAET